MLVTDSTSDLPESLRRQYQIEVVPLSVTIGNDSYRDGVEISAGDFIQRLRTAEKLPTTSQPPASLFAEAFQRGIDSGKDIICVTLSSKVSGTINSARLAAEQVGAERIRVIDSRAVTMQLGWLLVEAARAIDRGASSLDEVAAAVEDARERVRLYALLQTLDYVYKGGRIGRASHMIGSALGIKPIITFDNEGIVAPIERVRTWKKVINRALELTYGLGPLTDIAVVHSDNLEDANRVADTLRQRYPEANILVDYCGPVISTYAGPGAIGIVPLIAKS
jgi:DegV family protein with EDD domain